MKKRTRSLSSEFIPCIGIGVGIETYSYSKKDRNEYILMLPFFTITLSVVSYKMVREIDIKTSDL